MMTKARAGWWPVWRPCGGRAWRLGYSNGTVPPWCSQDWPLLRDESGRALTFASGEDAVRYARRKGLTLQVEE